MSPSIQAQYFFHISICGFRFGDWKLLYILAFNMPPLVLGEFLVELENQAVSRREGLEVTFKVQKCLGSFISSIHS